MGTMIAANVYAADDPQAIEAYHRTLSDFDNQIAYDLAKRQASIHAEQQFAAENALEHLNAGLMTMQVSSAAFAEIAQARAHVVRLLTGYGIETPRRTPAPIMGWVFDPADNTDLADRARIWATDEAIVVAQSPRRAE